MMAYPEEQPQVSGSYSTDNLSCAGILLICVLLLSTLGISLGTSTTQNGDTDALGQGLVTASPSPSSTIPRVLSIVEVMPTQVETATPFESSTLTPTAIMVYLPTRTPNPPSLFVDTLPNASAPRPTNTPPPALLPTPMDQFSQTVNVPILMYHYISEPPDDADKYRIDLSVSPDNFREQMTFLVDSGFTVIDLYDLSLAIVHKRRLPEKPVIITFDDGYRDNYEHAFPILQELQISATFFIVTDFIDQMNPAYLSWEMIDEMAAAGMQFESHSKSHPDLTKKDRDFIIWEILGSTETIEANLGQHPRYFAYPGGTYNDEIVTIVDELNFWGALTTEGGVLHGFHDRFEWTRVRIRYVTTMFDFIDVLE